jgi:predicted metal-dependent hydrolase
VANKLKIICLELNNKTSNNARLLFIKDIGEIKLVKSKRARRISIRVKPFEGVVVSIPFRASYKLAEEFALEKQNWIKNSLIKAEAFEERMTVFTEKSNFSTLKHQLIIEKWGKELLSVRVVNGKIFVKYPLDMNVRDEQIQNGIRRGIERALRIEAADYLPARIAYLAKRARFKYRGLTINNLKSRWGACTRDNQISLNVHLMRLPSRLIDYVIIHELCHTEQKNHSKRFWELMEKVMPGAKFLNKELSGYQTKIY